VHWEDFGGSNASRLLKKYQSKGPTFNDDIQSTAAVALASILGACQVASALPLPEQTFVFFGAGEANLGVAQLIVDALADNVRPRRPQAHTLCGLDVNLCGMIVIRPAPAVTRAHAGCAV
jgi:malic enzyme